MRQSRSNGYAWVVLGSALFGAGSSGCANSGFGKDVRADVTARMNSAQQPLAACYEAALARNRKLRGKMTVALTAESGSGKFTDVKIEQTELPDPEFERCVVETVSALKLDKPQKTKLAIQYPLDFGWQE